jgi:tripartite-type tricarboxylate transporter receptor subunit TctC
MYRRDFLGAGAALALLDARTWAQGAFPVKPVNIVVGYAAGGGVDFLARSISAPLGMALGQPVIVDNRPGASSIIAAQYVMRAPADGYTLFGADSGGLILNTALYSHLPYDTVRDFAPVSMLVRAPMLVVANPSFGANTLPELIALARQDRGKLNYASPGRGTSHQLGMEMLKQRAGFEAVDVSYKGAGPAVQDVIAGQVPLAVMDSIVALPQIRGGKLKVLATLTPERLKSLPEVPTAAEQGVLGAEAYGWTGIVAPKTTPADIVARLSSEIVKVTRLPEVSKRFTDLGLEPFTTTPQEFEAYIAAELKRWVPLIRTLNLKLD